MADDYASTIYTVGAVLAGGWSNGNIEASGDQDWFRVNMIAGHTYRIDLEGSPTSKGTLSDPYLRGIYNSSGTLIANTTNDDNGTNYNSRVQYAAGASGVYFVSAGAVSSNTGSYRLTVTDLTPSSTAYAIRAQGSVVKNEGNSGATYYSFLVTRTGTISQAGSVRYSVSGSGTNTAAASDFVGGAFPTGLVSFAAGQNSKVVNIAVAGNTVFENNEAFAITLSSPVNGTINSAAARVVGTIVNDDPRGLTINDDIYTGTLANDLIDGLAGDDFLYGRDGQDFLVGNRGDDHIFGGSGNDTIYADTSSTTSGSSGTQTVSGTGVIPSTSQNLSINLTSPTSTENGNVSVSGLVSRSAVQQGGFNIAYVIDRSGSMSSSFQGTETVPDKNGNGRSNELMDAAIQSFESLNASLISSGFGASRLGVIEFDDTASILYNGTLNSDANGNGVLDSNERLRTLTDSGSTYFDLGLQQAISFFQSAPAGRQNVVFFISDGAPNGGAYNDEVATLLNDAGINATIRAVGLGTGASLTALDLVDDGIANNSATRVSSPSALTAGLIASPVSQAEILRVELVRNGSVVATISSSQLVQTPLGLRYTANISGLVASDNTLIARVIASDAAHTTVSTGLHIGLGGINDNLLYGGSGNDYLFGGRGNDLLDGGSGVDTVNYSKSGAGVRVNLNSLAFQNTVGAGWDQLLSVENLTGSQFADVLTGNSIANVLNGSAGNDILSGNAGSDNLNGGIGNDKIYGGVGNDTLTGGTGSDTFLFNSSLNAATNRDSITDFNAVYDTVQLDRTIFTKLSTLGTLKTTYFKASTTGRAVDGDDYLLYNTTSGALFYDADGSGAGVATQFASLTTKVAITAADFVVVA